MKGNYPALEGWMTTTLKLPKPGYQLERDWVINIVMNARPQDYELAEYRELKTIVKLIYRKKRIKTTPSK